MKNIKSAFLRGFAALLLFTVVCGVIYPSVITVICQAAFHKQANGSIIEIDGKKYGSILLGQQFTGNKYMWGRIMNLDTSTFIGEDGEPLMYAVPSNITPAQEEYKLMIEDRVARLKEVNPAKSDQPIPSDLVTCSGSGLDPHISFAAAEYQIDRIAAERQIPAEEVQSIIEKYTTHKFLGVIGEKTVNVLQVNLSLDGILK